MDDHEMCIDDRLHSEYGIDKEIVPFLQIDEDSQSILIQTRLLRHVFKNHRFEKQMLGASAVIGKEQKFIEIATSAHKQQEAEIREELFQQFQKIYPIPKASFEKFVRVEFGVTVRLR